MKQIVKVSVAVIFFPFFYGLGVSAVIVSVCVALLRHLLDNVRYITLVFLAGNDQVFINVSLHQDGMVLRFDPDRRSFAHKCRFKFGEGPWREHTFSQPKKEEKK